MALGGKSSGDMVLETRHLVGLFFLMIVIFGVVFTLGYLMGRNQVEPKLRADRVNSSTRAAEVPSLKPPVPAAHPSVPAPSDWDYYRSPEPKNPAAPLDKSAKTGPAISKAAAPPAAAAAKPPSANTKSPGKIPAIPRGALVLQVAALTKEGDALALAESLQKKRFPAFVLTPADDHYYRIQVGPYLDARSAEAAQRGLEKQGFKAMIRR